MFDFFDEKFNQIGKDTSISFFSEQYFENAQLRVIFWKKSIGLIKENPIRGVGIGNWKIQIASSVNPQNPDHIRKNYTYNYPHNEFIGILSELGIVGFLVSLFLLFSPPIHSIYRHFKLKTDNNHIVLIYAIVTFGFLIYSFFDFPLKRIETLSLFTISLGFIFAELPNDKKSNGFVISSFIIKFLLCLFLLFAIIVSAFRLKGEYYTKYVFKDSNCSKKVAFGEKRTPKSTNKVNYLT